MEHVVDVDGDDPVLTGMIEEDAQRLLGALGVETSELSVVLTDDETIQGLNAQWRDKDSATDVLSFPQQEGPVTGGVLGDVVISLDTATRQADEVGHDRETELKVLLVHGLCHLLGHDHIDERDAEAMHREEVRLLAALGVHARDGLIGRAGR